MIWALVALDVVLLGILLLGMSIKNLSLSNGSVLIMLATSSFGPVIAGFVNELISSPLKATIVFWRLRFVLPSHYAFTSLALNDSRIDISKLKENIGELPEDPSAQNKLWYKLYRKHESDVRVASAHQDFLLYRDCASLSVLISLVLIFCTFIFELDTWQLSVLASGVILQYSICIIAGRNTGERFVQNVLVAESH